MDRSIDRVDQLWDKIRIIDNQIGEVLERLQTANRLLRLMLPYFERRVCETTQEWAHKRLKRLQARRLELVEEIRRENNYTDRVV